MGARVSTGADSKQNYRTPDNFTAAVERRFGLMAFDLAADESNHQTARWFGPGGEAEDALVAPWTGPGMPSGLLFLNPPFASIGPWVAKCVVESQRGATVALLVPAAVGSNWFRDHVAPRADVYLLNGRLCFDGKGLYPKDCLIALYRGGGRGELPTICIWDWRKDRLVSPWK